MWLNGLQDGQETTHGNFFGYSPSGIVLDFAHDFFSLHPLPLPWPPTGRSGFGTLSWPPLPFPLASPSKFLPFLCWL